MAARRSPRRERIVKGSVLGAMLGLFILALFIFVLPFAFPTPPPIITRFQATSLFSPNGDGRRDVARVNIRVHEPSTVRLEIRGGGRTIATLIDGKRLPKGWHSVQWDGRDADGAALPDGAYAIKLLATAAGGKRFDTTRSITIDTVGPRPAAFRVVSATLAGPGPGECRTAFTAGDAGSVLFEAVRPGAPVPLTDRGPRPVPADGKVRWSWGGRSDTGTAVAPGLYYIRATLRDAAGNQTPRERTCWVGRLAGTVTPAAPGPGTDIAVRLRTTDGAPLPGATPITLEFRRRTGVPGVTSTPPLGSRIGARYRGPAAGAAIATPRGIRPSALWLVARAPSVGAVALIDLGSTP